MTLEYSSNPDSELNELRRAVWAAREGLGRANRSRDRGSAGEMLSAISKEKAKLRRVAARLAGRTPPTDPIEPDFETVVQGIPCGVVIESAVPAHNGGTDEPPAEAEIEWSLVDRGGYPAAWIELKTSESERIDIYNQCLAFLEDRG